MRYVSFQGDRFILRLSDDGQPILVVQSLRLTFVNISRKLLNLYVFPTSFYGVFRFFVPSKHRRQRHCRSIGPLRALGCMTLGIMQVVASIAAVTLVRKLGTAVAALKGGVLKRNETRLVAT